MAWSLAAALNQVFISRGSTIFARQKIFGLFFTTSFLNPIPFSSCSRGSGAATLLAVQWEVFSKHQTNIEKLNEELFLENRVKAYIDYMNNPSQENKYRLILVGSRPVLTAMGELYSNFCNETKKCENTCKENRAFVKLFQAMRNDFQLTRTDPVLDRDIYKARYYKDPKCF